MNQKHTAHYFSLFTELNGNNQQTLFKTINKLFDHNRNNLSLRPHNDLSTLSDSFNHYFLNKVSDTLFDNTFTDTLTPLLSIPDTYQLSSFEPTTVDDLAFWSRNMELKNVYKQPSATFSNWRKP